MLNVSKLYTYLAAAFLLFIVVTSTLLTLNNHYEQQFVYLSKSFMHGKVYFTEKPGSWLDAVYKDGHYYWHMGPAPAIIIMPFVFVFSLFGGMFYQGYLQLAISIGVFYLCYLLAKRYKYNHRDSVSLAFAFCFGSVYIIVAYLSWSWYFAQAITVVLLLFSLWEWHMQKRYWVIGVCFAIICATRITATFGLLFFMFDILWSEKTSTIREKVKPIIHLIIPLVIVVIGLMWYNQTRLGSPFDTGFKLSNNRYAESYYHFEQTHYGLFQLRNIPTNVYYYFLKTLDPVRVEHYDPVAQTYVLKFPYITVRYPGTSFFVSSPLFIYAVYAAWKKRSVRVIKLCLIPIVIIQLILLTYYYPGWKQVGPRYMLDFLPFLYLILLQAFERSRLTITAKTLIASSLVLNSYLVFSALLALP